VTRSNVSPAPLLASLALDPRWLEWGYVDEALLAAQCEAKRQGAAGHSPEHYRLAAYAAFHERFAGVTIPQADVERYMELVAVEPDLAARAWAISFLVEREPLATAQIDWLAVHPLVVATKHAAFLERNRRRQHGVAAGAGTTRAS